MNEFYPDVFAGNLVELQLPPKGIASGKFLVYSVEHSLEAQRFQTTLSIVEWSDVAFSLSDKEITQTTPEDAVLPDYSEVASRLQTLDNSMQDLTAQVQEIDNRTSYIDGSAPATPAGLSLATLNEDGRSYITASWNANTEPDLLGYELAWSYDGVNWNYITTADTLVRFEVAGNKTVYVKVRAHDAEGKRSGWSTVQSITSAKDTTPPAIPTGLTATGLFQTIMVKWNKNTETDFDHYVLEYDTSDTFPAPKQIVTSSNYATLKELTVNTTYYIRIKAVDKSGNESDWSITVSASTVKIDNENYYDYAAIKDAIIHNGYIDSAWISELDAGLIKSGYIDADRIAAGSITAEKLSILPAFSVPAGTIAYWTNSLVDEINSIVPEGLTTINLAPTITLTPENAPEGSVVGDLLAGNQIFAGKSIQVGSKVFIENTSDGKGIIRVNSGGTDIVKIGEGAIDGTTDGIRLNAANLEVDGEIATRYIRLTDSVIVDLQDWEYLVEHTITNAQQNYLYTFSADIMRDNVTIWTPLGSKAYIDRVPIQISVYFNWGTSIVGGVTLSVKINSTEVFHYYKAGYGNVVDTVVKDIFKNYSVPIGSTLYVTVLPQGTSQIDWTLRVAVPKTLFIVPVR
jgi:hypothetical protein